MVRSGLFVFFILLNALAGIAQDEEDWDLVDPVPIRLKGQILSLENELPVSYASVVNMRTHGGTTANELGIFTLEMLNVDSLAVSALGFTKAYIKVPSDYNQLDVHIIYLKPVRFALQEVKVKGESNKVNMEGIPVGKKLDLDPQLRSDSYNEKPPVIAALVTPLSFIQYHASKKEKEKREARRAIITEMRWEQLSLIYNKEVVMELTGLNKYEADEFMIYFNKKGILAEVTTEYEVREAIVEQYLLYQKEKSNQ